MSSTERDQARGYAGFAGKVGRTFSESEPAWPERIAAPAAAPNIVFIVVDDVGFSDIGCFGAEIDTPNIDALADRGVRFSDFHVSPLCSPTRASLLTGINSHAAGFGFTNHIDPGFPGYSSELPTSQPTVAEALRDRGYSTLMVGKWHLCKEIDQAESGDRHSWPLQRGFDQFYGFLEALTDLHHPHRLYEGNSVQHLDEYPPGYYLTDDLTDRAIRMVKEAKAADADKPFFLYFAHAAAHAPMHAKPDDIEKYRGRYDAGWDQIRSERFAKQERLGIVPPGTVISERSEEMGLGVPDWDTLGAPERAVASRHMEVYAAMVDSIDQSVGRLRQTLEALDEWDNTLVVFLSDNGPSRHVTSTPDAIGTTSYFGWVPRKEDRSQVGDKNIDLEALGGPTSWPHYPRGWAMVGATPYRQYKMSTFRGGHQVPMIVSWPEGLGAHKRVTHDYAHVTDIVPTISEILGFEMPSTRAGLAAEPLVGSSLLATLRDPASRHAHGDQYYEVIGNRAYYQDGWEAVSIRRGQQRPGDDAWELFNVRDDPAQRIDLAADEPERLEQMIKDWDDAAWRNRVYPIDEGVGLPFLWSPPAPTESPVTILPGTPTLDRSRSSRLTSGDGFRLRCEGAFGPADEGVLVAHGSQAAGYVLYIEGGLIHFASNEFGEVRWLEPVPLGEVVTEISVDVSFAADRSWSIRVEVDGEPRATGSGFAPFVGFLPFEGIDVGIDRRSPVLWDLRQRRGTFPFTGALRSVTYHPRQVSPESRKHLIDQAIAVGTGLQ